MRMRGSVELLLLLLFRAAGFAFDGLFRLGEAGDELDEAVAVLLGRDGGDLRFRVGDAFPEVLGSFDETVLRDAKSVGVYS